MKKLLLSILFIFLGSLNCYAGSYTTKLALYKPSSGETGWATTVNSNFNILDDSITTWPGVGIAVSTGSAWGTSVANASANWNTAYGWGNHASAGYLTVETDPAALKTAGTDNVKDTHIDWGTGAGQVNPADFADQDVGDITVTTGAWAVEDDSHAHTTSSISGLVDADMSNDALDPDKLVGDAVDDDKIAAALVVQHAGTDITADLEEEVTEGSLADSTIVSADIKDGTIVAADTAITAGRSLTWSTNDLAADAELYTVRFNAGIENPVAADDNLLQIEPAGAFTITEVACSTDAGTATINFNENVNTTPDTAGTAILSADIVCDTGRQSSCAAGCDVNTISNAGISAGNLISVMTTSVASSPAKLRIHIKGTYDD